MRYLVVGYTCTLIALILSIAALATSVVNDRSYVLTYDAPQPGAGVAYWVDTYKTHAKSTQISMWGYRISVDAYPDANVKDNFGGGTDVAATTDITPLSVDESDDGQALLKLAAGGNDATTPSPNKMKAATGLLVAGFVFLFIATIFQTVLRTGKCIDSKAMWVILMLCQCVAWVLLFAGVGAASTTEYVEWFEDVAAQHKQASGADMELTGSRIGVGGVLFVLSGLLMLGSFVFSILASRRAASHSAIP